MASIYKDFVIHAPPNIVWEAVRDVGAVHKRLVPGLVVEAHLEGDARIVTFANGMVLRELIILWTRQHVDLFMRQWEDERYIITHRYRYLLKAKSTPASSGSLMCFLMTLSLPSRLLLSRDQS
jgi:hypothetical protein